MSEILPTTPRIFSMLPTRTKPAAAVLLGAVAQGIKSPLHQGIPFRLSMRDLDRDLRRRMSATLRVCQKALSDRLKIPFSFPRSTPSRGLLAPSVLRLVGWLLAKREISNGRAEGHGLRFGMNHLTPFPVASCTKRGERWRLGRDWPAGFRAVALS